MADAVVVDSASRLEAELEILSAMYPEDNDGDSRNSSTVNYSTSRRELRFITNAATTTTNSTGTLLLRIPPSYPVHGFPEILTASCTLTNDGRHSIVHKDLRIQTKKAFRALNLPEGGDGGGGEEVLDALLLAFLDLIETETTSSVVTSGDENASLTQNSSAPDSPTSSQHHHHHHHHHQQRPYKTVIIWLHHLLNTNKRKLALHPSLTSTSPLAASTTTTTTTGPSPSAASQITGLSKPGYPGILLFSGPRDLIAAHVSELRAQRWQAFQVRYDSDDDDDPVSASSAKSEPGDGLWSFEHPAGTILEVESIAQAAKCIVGASQREVFLAAVGVK